MLPDQQKAILRPTFFLAAYAVALLLTINLWGPVESSEARYAEMAREMVLNGDWMHPTLLQIQHYDKPPLTYWLTAIGYKFFGFHPAGFRFFLAISLLFQVWLVYQLASLLLNDERLAFISGWVYASMPLVITSARGLTTDCYLNTFMLATLFCLVQWRGTGRPKWLYGAALALGLGFLTKGPLILIFPALFLIGFRKILPRARFTGHHLAAFGLFLVVGFGWYVVLVIQDPRFIHYFLLHQTYDRVAHAEVFARREPFWYYAAFTPLAMLPWSVVLIAGFIRNQWKSVPAVYKKLSIFLVIIPLLFFSLVSSKLMLYVLPVFPACAWITAWFLSQLKFEKLSAKSFYIYFALLIVGCFLIPVFDTSFHFTIILWVLPVAAIVLMFVLYRPNLTGVLRGTGVFTIFLIVFSAFLMHSNELEVNGTTPLAAWIKQHDLSNRPILAYNQLLPSAAFNLNKGIISLADGNRYLNRSVSFEKDTAWRSTLYNLDEPAERARLQSVMEQHPVMLVKGSVNDRSRWLLTYFQGNEKIGRWVIYY